MTQYMNPPLTTYSVPIADLAKNAVNCVIEHIEGKKEKMHIVIEGEVAERNSVKNLNNWNGLM